MSQDFKEAARLSAEAKALAAEAEEAHARAKAMSDEFAELAARESVQHDEVDLLDEALAEARRSLALAQWRRLQVLSKLAVYAHPLPDWPGIFSREATHVDRASHAGLVISYV